VKRGKLVIVLFERIPEVLYKDVTAGAECPGFPLLAVVSSAFSLFVQNSASTIQVSRQDRLSFNSSLLPPNSSEHPHTIKMRTLQLAIAFCLSFITFGYASDSSYDDMDYNSMAMSMVTNMSESSWKSIMDSHHNETHNNELFQLCEELQHLEELILIVSNATKLAEVEKEKNLTSEDIAKLKDEATNATMKLNELKSNTTLVKECLIVEAHLQLLHECQEIVELIIIVDIAMNETLLMELEKETKHNLTDAQDAMLKELAANATTKLATFEKNSTLIADCKTLLNITLNLNTATTTTKLTATTSATHLSTASSLKTTAMTMNATASSMKMTTSTTLAKTSSTSAGANKLNTSTTMSKILHLDLFWSNVN